MTTLPVLARETCLCECQDCGHIEQARTLNNISDAQERLSAGEIVPAGECSQCGALSHALQIGDIKMSLAIDVVGKGRTTISAFFAAEAIPTKSDTAQRIWAGLVDEGEAQFASLKITRAPGPPYRLYYMCDGEIDCLVEDPNEQQAMFQRIAPADARQSGVPGDNRVENIVQALDQNGFYAGYHEHGAFVLLDLNRIPVGAS